MIIESIRARFYQGSLRAIVKKMGMERLLIRIYRAYMDWITGNTTEFVIQDERIIFPTEGKQASSVIYNLESEREIVLDLLFELRSDDVFYDIGADIGIYSAIVGRQSGFDGEIYAFDPDESSEAAFYDTMSMNNVSATRLSFAIGEEVSKGGDFSTATVHSLITDGFAPTPDIVKIDVEGAEYDVLRGMADVEKLPRVIYIEIHPELLAKQGLGKQDVVNWLSNHDYKVEILNERMGLGIETNQPMIKATHRLLHADFDDP